MAVIFKKVEETAILSADAEVKTKDGVLEVSFVETQRIPNGNLNGVMQISLNGKPLLITSSSVMPKSYEGKSKIIQQQFKVYDGDKVNELSEDLARAFGKLRKELIAFEKKKSVTLRLPCFIRIPLCRLTYSQYIVACRLRGRPALECLREAEAIYNNCKGNC
ncbi:hypothetical protein [Paenibacillus radicis (ex Xue et al. 2023)]|uniref:Uncharacterized protein n=1 Tax=Paenibacillus radicis (ex Xue et al. 2023) TaxID=2972489 RepID=A0ABT1YI73_9BACL|nr:hypothetical protein [Paenibacillus radicis (ex Xue et al. 2023)]MCR8632129.1 hypothetical protein [Paenibacillus radicis (ex Xue et al. 2023)]